MDHRNPIGSIRSGEGILSTNREDTLRALIGTHFPGYIPQSPRTKYDSKNSEMVGSGPIVKTRAYKISKDICTEEAIKWAINSFEPYKAPGPDGIYPIFLQKGLDQMMPLLRNIFRASLALEYIPVAWREVRLVFIPKAGKQDTSEAKAYRPISLTSFFLKSLEKMIDIHIRNSVLTRHPLAAEQHAYQAGKSTETALHTIVRKIENTLAVGQVLMCTFLDVQGAFDNTNFEVLKNATIGRGVNPVIVGWTVHMLKQRKIKASLGDANITFRPTRGCSQGGVLSPLMWLLVVDELLLRLRDEGLQCVGYADDIAIMVQGNYEDTVAERMQRGLKIVDKWCTEAGLSVNPKKTHGLIFTRRRKLKYRVPTIGGNPIHISKEIRYLGVTLDTKLTWNPHIKYMINRANMAFHACRQMIGKTWGLNPKMVVWLHTSIIRPIICYAALVWWPKTNQSETQKSLNKLQRTICLCATGAVRSCPTMALERLL